MFTGVTLYSTSTKFIRIRTQLCLHLAHNTKKHLKYIEECNFFYVWKRFNTVNSLTQHRMLARNEQSDLIHNYARNRVQSFLSHSTNRNSLKPTVSLHSKKVVHFLTSLKVNPRTPRGLVSPSPSPWHCEGGFVSLPLWDTSTLDSFTAPSAEWILQ